MLARLGQPPLLALLLDARELLLVLADLLPGSGEIALDVVGRDPGHLQQDFRAGVGEVLRAAEAVSVQQLDGRLRQPDGGERPRGELAHLLHPGFAVDVELPAGELRRQAHVLPAPADGQRKLVVGDDDLHRPVLVVEQHAADLGRLQRVADETGGVVVPGNDVNLLAAQLLHHRLHAATLHTHAGAHRVDVGVAGGDGDLGPAARLPRHGLDHHDPFGDLRDLHLEQLAHQLRRGPGEDDLRPLALAQHVEHEGLHPVTGAVALARRLLADREHRLRAAEVDDDVAALEPQRDSRDDFALAVLVVVEDVLALGVARALDDHLLGGLRGDAAEALSVRLQPEDVAVALVLDAGLFLVLRPVEDLEEQLVADLGLDSLLASFLQRDLVHRLDRVLHLDALHDGQGLEHFHDLLLLVVGRLDRAVLAEVLLRGMRDGILQRIDEDGELDALVLRDLVEDHVQVDDRGLRCWGSHFFSLFSIQLSALLEHWIDVRLADLRVRDAKDPSIDIQHDRFVVVTL